MGSLAGNVLKCIAVSPVLHSGLSLKLLTEPLTLAYEANPARAFPAPLSRKIGCRFLARVWPIAQAGELGWCLPENSSER